MNVNVRQVFSVVLCCCCGVHLLKATVTEGASLKCHWSTGSLYPRYCHCEGAGGTAGVMAPWIGGGTAGVMAPCIPGTASGRCKSAGGNAGVMAN